MPSKNPRCTGFDRRGLQCGRSVTDGSTPPLCHIHAAKLTGAPMAGQQMQFQSTLLDPREVIQRLMTSSEPAIRLRASTWLMDWAEKEKTGCPRCARQDSGLAEPRDAMDRFTPDQAALFRELIAEGLGVKKKMNALVRSALAQPLWEDWLRANTPAAVTLPDSRPPIPVVKPPVERPRVETEPPPFPLDKSLWSSCGVFLSNGIPTHDLGDEHAELILRGEIALETAQAEHRLVQKRKAKMAGNLY